MNFGAVGNIPIRECGTQVVEELPECGSVEQLECFILSDDKFD